MPNITKYVCGTQKITLVTYTSNDAKFNFSRMNFFRHIVTHVGDIWVVDAHSNGFEKNSTETRQEYESRVLNKIISVVLGGDVERCHESNGAPFIANYPTLQVSISHSEHWFAVYLSNGPRVGVDIELATHQLEGRGNYFLQDLEMERLQPTIEQLQICWGIKEAVYKLFKGELDSLKHDIEITSLLESTATAICKNKVIQLNHQQEESYTLVYTHQSSLV